MKKLLPFVLLFFISTPVMAERVASVIGGEGVVTVIGEGNDLPVTRGETLYKADQITTGRDSAIELKMLDGSFINLGELADMLIKELVFDPIKKDGFMDLEVAVGAFRAGNPVRSNRLYPCSHRIRPRIFLDSNRSEGLRVARPPIADPTGCNTLPKPLNANTRDLPAR